MSSLLKIAIMALPFFTCINADAASETDKSTHPKTGSFAYDCMLNAGFGAMGGIVYSLSRYNQKQGEAIARIRFSYQKTAFQMHMARNFLNTGQIGKATMLMFLCKTHHNNAKAAIEAINHATQSKYSLKHIGIGAALGLLIVFSHHIRTSRSKTPTVHNYRC